MFTEEHLISFQKMYKEQFGEDIDRAEALRQATALVSLVKLTWEPMTKAEYIKYAQMAEDLRAGKRLKDL